MKERIRRIGCLMACVTLFSTGAWASTSQSTELDAVAHPAGSLDLDLKAKGFPPVHSDTDFLGGETADVVARRAAVNLCHAITGLGITCTGTTSCSTDVTTFPVLGIGCSGGARGERFNISQTDPLPDIVATAPAGGDVANLSVRGWPSMSSDIASRVLLQLRPNGINGTVNIVITHTQGGQNPKTATVANVNNFASSQLLHEAIRDAINALAFAPDVIAVTHPSADAVPPLSYSSDAYCSIPGGFFVEITNAAAAGVTKVQMVGVSGQGLTVEGTENTPDTPALGTWGILLVLVMLLLSGYWLMRRRAGMATA